MVWRSYTKRLHGQRSVPATAVPRDEHISWHGIGAPMFLRGSDGFRETTHTIIGKYEVDAGQSYSISWVLDLAAWTRDSKLQGD